MKIIAISDLHGDLIEKYKLPAGDVLVIAGDVLPDDYHFDYKEVIKTSRIERQGKWYDKVWLPYLGTLQTKFPNVIWIAGNHDFFLQAVIFEPKMPEGVHYLNESSVTIDGIKFYGAPWNMTQGWAFAIDEKDYAKRLGTMPSEVDVLITHGPPAVKGMPGAHWTSEILAAWITLTPYKAVICGHIHEAYGTYKIEDVPIYVVSSKNRDYELVNKPVEIEVNKDA